MIAQSKELPAGMIHERLIAVMEEVEHIKKENHSKGLNFAFRGIEHVMNSLHVLFKKHGVLIVTEIVKHEMHEIETARGTKGYHHLSRVAFHLTASDGSRCTVLSLGEALDYGDKGATKTLSIALKYALLNLFLIPTKETAELDPDADSSHEIASKPAPKLAADKPKPDPRALMAKRIEADPKAHWFEIVAWERGERKGMTLGDVAANGDAAPIKQILDYIDPVALEHELAVKRLKEAITEAESCSKEKSEKVKPDDDIPTCPKTGADKPF